MKNIIINICSALIIFGLIGAGIKGYLHYKGKINILEKQAKENTAKINKQREYINEVQKINENKSKAYKTYNSKSGIELNRDLNELLQNFDNYRNTSSETADSTKDTI